MGRGDDGRWALRRAGCFGSADAASMEDAGEDPAKMTGVSAGMRVAYFLPSISISLPRKNGEGTGAGSPAAGAGSSLVKGS